MSVELEVVEREPVELTTTAIIPAPAAGWSLELDRTDAHVRVRQVRGDESTAWMDVVPLSLLQGADGSTPVLRATATHIEWSPDEVEWFPLVALVDLKGQDGDPGEDAYQIAVSLGYDGTREEWLASLDGSPGLNAYQLAVLHGFEGTVEQWIASLQGQEGASAYKVAQEAGFTGSQAQWLASLKGDAGLSAYAVAVQNGFVGTPVAWLNSLKGDPGSDGWSVEVQKSATHIQTRRVRGTETTAWTNLVALSDISGQPGSPGAQGASGMPNTDLVGTGMPNGVVTASPGTVYRDTAGTNGAWLWIKKTGTNNVGWHVLEGDTGRRKLTLGAGLTGNVYIQRDAKFVTLSMEGVANTVTGEVQLLDAGLPSPWQSTVRRFGPIYRAGVVMGAVDANSNNVWRFTISTQSSFLTAELNFRARPGGTAADSWPVGALPGTPA